MTGDDALIGIGKRDLTFAERDVLKSVLYELNRLLAFCDDWLDHYHATQPLDSETFLSTIATKLTYCRNDIRSAAKTYKVRARA